MKNSEAGFTLTEVMVASAVVMTGVLGAGTMITHMYKVKQVLQSHSSLSQVRADIYGQLQRDKAWWNTYNNQKATVFSCVGTNTCGPSMPGFVIYDVANQPVVDLSTTYYSLTGEKSNTANVRYPLQAVLSWSVIKGGPVEFGPVSPFFANQVFPDQIGISLSFQLVADPAIQLELVQQVPTIKSFNFASLGFTIVRPAQ